MVVKELNGADCMKRASTEIEIKECPLCHSHINSFEMYCKCGYEFEGIVVQILSAENHVEILQVYAQIVKVKIKMINRVMEMLIWVNFIKGLAAKPLIKKKVAGRLIKTNQVMERVNGN